MTARCGTAIRTGSPARPPPTCRRPPLAPTNDDIGLGSLDHSAAAGWIATGWRGADWQDPALYRSSDLATWTLVGELPGHGFDVAAVTVAVDLSALPTLPTPVAVTGSGCPPVDGEQAIVTKGQMTCAAIARVGFDSAGPYTGGQHVAPKWHHWGCDWYVIPRSTRAGGRHCTAPVVSRSMSSSGPWTRPRPHPRRRRRHPLPAPDPTGPACRRTAIRHPHLHGAGERVDLCGADRGDRRVLPTDRPEQLRPADGWSCHFPSAESVDWICGTGDGISISAYNVDGTGGSGSGGSGSDGGGGGGSGATDGEISVSKPMATPACDGTPIVIYASAVTPGRYSADIQATLDAHPGATWVRTDRSCSSFAQATSDGGPIYAIYQPFPSVNAACAEVAAVGGSAGRRFLDNGSLSTSVYSC